MGTFLVLSAIGAVLVVVGVAVLFHKRGYDKAMLAAGEAKIQSDIAAAAEKVAGK